MDALPDLLESSNKFMNGAVPAEVSNKALSQKRSQLLDKRSSLTRSGNRLRADLESCLHDQSSIFLDVSKALPLLYGKHNSENLQGHGLDSVFHAANLAILVQRLLLYPQQDSDSFLEQLDIGFPTFFTDDQFDTFELKLETRTQHAIMQLSDHVDQANFDHDLVLNRVFFEDDGTTLKGFDHMPGRSKEAKLSRKSMLERIQAIRQFWNQKNSPSPIESLQNFYSWDKYIEQIMVWIKEKKEESKAQMDAAEIGDVVETLKTTIQAMRRPKQSSQPDAEANLNSGQIDLSGFVPPSDVVGATTRPQDVQPQSKTRDRELAGPGYLKYVFDYGFVI